MLFYVDLFVAPMSSITLMGDGAIVDSASSSVYPPFEWVASITTPLWSPGWLFTAATLFIVLRFMKIFDYADKPKVSVMEEAKGSRIKELLSRCTMLQKPYNPPLLWGRNGHIQTAIYGLLGHATLKRTYDQRHFIRQADGTTMTFDVFEPIQHHSSGKDVTLVLCPGIANSSESNYIRTCTNYAQSNGIRCAVLNHLGALKNIKLTSNRIFTYGGTDEYEAMFRHLCDLYPSTRFVCVGFSMGANITTRYMGTGDKRILDRVLCALSVCQGYCATRSTPLYHDWEGGRRFYNYVITENLKRLLRRHYDEIVAPHVKSGLVDEQRLWTATSVMALDEQYSRRVAKFSTVEDYYKWVSSIHIIPDITLPIVFLNALDDPLIPPTLWEPVKSIVDRSTEKAFVLTKHGGHLGFLEGSLTQPSSVSWLDRFIVELVDSAVHVYGDNDGLASPLEAATPVSIVSSSPSNESFSTAASSDESDNFTRG